MHFGYNTVSIRMMTLGIRLITTTGESVGVVGVYVPNSVHSFIKRGLAQLVRLNDRVILTLGTSFGSVARQVREVNRL